MTITEKGEAIAAKILSMRATIAEQHKLLAMLETQADFMVQGIDPAEISTTRNRRMTSGSVYFVHLTLKDGTTIDLTRTPHKPVEIRQ